MAKITKTASYSPEQEVPRSPARSIVREWATPSYDKDGRACNYSEGGGKRQVPSAGRHTNDNSTKASSKPGRW